MSFCQKYGFKSNLFLAPMEACSDVAFRTLCYEQGAALTYIEMIRAYAITKKKKKMLEKLDPSPKIRQGLQLAAVKVNELKKTLLYIKKRQEENDPKFLNIETIDLNLGCPSPGIISEGAGPALLKRTARVKELFEVMRSEWNGPVSAKMRLGMNEKEKRNKVYIRALQAAENIGLDWVTVHPKTVDEDSNKPIDIESLRECAESVSIPVIGNGFVTDEASAERMLKTGVRGLMIARAAVGDPYIFKRLDSFVAEGKKISMPPRSDFEDCLQKYLTIAEAANVPEYYVDYHTEVFKKKISGEWRHFHSPKTFDRWS